MLMFLQSAPIPGITGIGGRPVQGPGGTVRCLLHSPGMIMREEGEMRRVREYLVMADERESEKGRAPGRQDDAGATG